ncbi:hypothetical protein EDB81DRAFT_730265 [Dactylonectria macrodidyma]|uniref:Uncharacterized protein n=1 Tax=Dactylonectria macrodidyma TaxID=307937 RepID=A0A9P9DVT2_9HYPO|nr:hypothetical protein EDB81DRAFT_730265 [Dactylonectria macrodidyma]
MAPKGLVVTPSPVEDEGPDQPPTLKRRLTSLKKRLSFKTKSKGPAEWLLEGTAGKPKSILQSTQLKLSNKDVTSEGGHKFLCSYTWTQGDTPTIYVPGDPPQCVLPAKSFKVRKDSKKQAPTEKDFPVPRHPFEPTFRAMELMNPDFKFNDIHVLITRNSLRKLFDFCLGKCNFDFRLNLYMVNNTLVVERWEKNASDLVRPRGNTGWGRNFEKQITQTPLGMKDIGTHHRLLQYNFGGHRCAVLCEVDAACDDGPRDATSEAAPLEQNDAADVKVIRGGIRIPHEKAVEIKSKAGLKSKISIGPRLQQLWFGRTQNLIWSRHNWGQFEPPRIKDVESQFAHWEARNQTVLRKIAGILTSLQGIVNRTQGRACIAFCQKKHRLRIGKPLLLKVYQSVEGKMPLPEDLCQKFWG